MTASDTTGRPDVSILIVNYNVKDYLLQCLRSIRDRDDDLRVQIVVVDNASTDGTVEELQPQFPDVEWIPLAENVGFGRGNNRGLEACTGRFVLFLNPDTIISQDTLTTMVNYLDAHPDVGLAGCKVLNPDGTFQLACRRGLPTPWASFCKLFGLQSLFPKSRLFAGYNLTYKPIDATYDVDALIGAFMMGPREVIEQAGGFDPQFFMYGEDLDLCYRIQQSGKAIRYVHETSIVHFKGESTKRSSMNEVRVFYQAMEIFARKHFGRSRVFLGFMRLGITMRSGLERLLRRKREVLILIADLIGINLALMAATAVRFQGPFGFPDYAYPTVFIVVSLVALLSLISVGEYVEYRPTVRRSVVGLLVTFFVLSSLTYFFKEYAFSRGVVLMTIGFTAVIMAATRGLFSLYDAAKGAGKTRVIVLVGLTEASKRILAALQTAEHRNAQIAGFVSVGAYREDSFEGQTVLGTTEYLDKIVEETGAEEVIVADPAVTQADAMRLMQRTAPYRARFHLASQYDDIVTARIINDVAGTEPTVHVTPLLRFRNRLVKRSMDLVAAFLVVPILAVRLSLGSSAAKERWHAWISVLKGSSSLVGLYPDGVSRPAGKLGITGLAHVSDPAALSQTAIEHLNDYYVDAYSLALDVEILLKLLLRRRGPNNRYP